MEKDKKDILNSYSFDVFWKDEHTAHVEVKPSEVLITRYVKHPVKQIFAADKMTRYQLNKILELRCWDRNRADINDILHHLGLSEYNPQQIVRKTHGVSYNDFIWFRFPGETITSKDVLVRS